MTYTPDYVIYLAPILLLLGACSQTAASQPGDSLQTQAEQKALSILESASPTPDERQTLARFYFVSPEGVQSAGRLIAERAARIPPAAASEEEASMIQATLWNWVETVYSQGVSGSSHKTTLEKIEALPGHPLRMQAALALVFLPGWLTDRGIGVLELLE